MERIENAIWEIKKEELGGIGLSIGFKWVRGKLDKRGEDRKEMLNSTELRQRGEVNRKLSQILEG